MWQGKRGTADRREKARRAKRESREAFMADKSPAAMKLKATLGLDMVNHPRHYGGDVPHEVWKCLKAWGLENDALLWNAVKYIARAGKKGDLLEDLKKARWYLENRIQSLERKDDEAGNSVC